MSKVMQSVLALLNRTNTWLLSQIFNKNVTVNGWLYNPGVNAFFNQNLTATTTTSTSPVKLGGANGSAGITIEFSGNLNILVVVRSNNNTIGDGVVIGLYQGASNGALTTLLDSETYVQEGLAGNSHTFLFYYEVVGLTLGSTYYFTVTHNAVTGGTVSSKLIGFSAQEF